MEGLGREGEDIGQVGGFVDGQAHAAIRVIFRVAEYDISHQRAEPFEEILGAPQNPQRAAIRSKCILVADKYDYCVSQARPNSWALGSVLAHC